MTDEQFTALTALLVEIRELLKNPPPRKSAGVKRDDSPRPPPLAAPDEPWARFVWPPFTKKTGTLGESVATERGIGNLAWWAEKYEPREYKGTIAAKDIEFRQMLDAAAKWLASQGTADHVSAPPPTAARKPEPTELELANQTDGEPNVMF